MHTIHITAEFAPLAKAGGLGEAVFGLCQELTRQGVHTEVILPRYRCIDPVRLEEFCPDPMSFSVPFGGTHFHATSLTGVLGGCLVHLLDVAAPDAPFQREKIYGYPDDLFRFLLFSRAATEWLKRKEISFDALHLHDWHTAAVAPLARQTLHLPIKKILLTLHSAEYQGPCSSEDLEKIGLFHQKGPLLALGARAADQVTTVSPTYAKEILTPEYGFGLDPLFRSLNPPVKGILNGLSRDAWDPKRDAFLPKPYGKGDTLQAILEGKNSAKKAVERHWKTSFPKRPWVGSITRLAEQKGLDLLEEGVRQTVQKGGVFFLLGSPQDSATEKRFRGLEEELRKTGQVRFQLAFEEKLSHLLYAALDFFFIPSLYEPCGLAQMMAMNYGAIPIARATGGLKDTVFDCEDSLIAKEKRNGFLFSSRRREELEDPFSRAFSAYRNDKALIELAIQQGIKADFSWKKSAMAYQKLYAEAGKTEKEKRLFPKNGLPPARPSPPRRRFF